MIFFGTVSGAKGVEVATDGSAPSEGVGSGLDQLSEPARADSLPVVSGWKCAARPMLRAAIWTAGASRDRSRRWLLVTRPRAARTRPSASQMGAPIELAPMVI